MTLSDEPLVTTAQIEELAEELRKCDIIAFDTEFIRESTFYPQLEIIQIATEHKAWLVDARAFLPHPKSAHKGYSRNGHSGKIVTERAVQNIEPLLQVLQDPKILKAVHAAQGDQECLYTAFGITAKPTFDTSQGASLCGYGDGVGLGNLLKKVLDVKIKKGHARTDWSARPLRRQLIDYALNDVVHLVTMTRRLLEELTALGRKDWALEISAQFEEPALYSNNATGIAEKLAKSGRVHRQDYEILLELVKWREKRVRELNVPRRWLADDSVILDLAHVKPRELGHLESFRGLNKGEVRKSGKQILDLIQKAIQAVAAGQGTALPRSRGGRAPDSEEARTASLLKVYLAILADQHKIASKHLMDPMAFTSIIRSEILSVDDLVREGILTHGAALLVGQDILDFLNGQKALAIREGNIHLVSVP